MTPRKTATHIDPVAENLATYSVEPQPKRSLFNISDDLEKLNDLLDEVGVVLQKQEQQVVG